MKLTYMVDTQEILGIETSSFRRMPESSRWLKTWIPAFAGMTNNFASYN